MKAPRSPAIQKNTLAKKGYTIPLCSTRPPKTSPYTNFKYFPQNGFPVLKEPRHSEKYVSQKEVYHTSIVARAPPKTSPYTNFKYFLPKRVSSCTGAKEPRHSETYASQKKGTPYLYRSTRPLKTSAYTNFKYFPQNGFPVVQAFRSPAIQKHMLAKKMYTIPLS